MDSDPYSFNPAVDNSLPASGASMPVRRGWWLPFIAGIVITPFAFPFAVSYGHAPNPCLLDRILDGAVFSTATALGKWFRSEDVRGALVLLQFPVYGFVMSLCLRRNRLFSAVVILSIVHCATYLTLKVGLL
jgi:hypothetical protein